MNLPPSKCRHVRPRWHSWTVVFFVPLTIAAIACGKSPTRVYEAMEEAAREGNAAEFASHFTQESRPFAEALISLYATETTAEGPTPTPLALLSRSTVEAEEIEGDRAFLRIRAPSEQGSGSYTLVFKREEGAWKLDLRETERTNIQSVD